MREQRPLARANRHAGFARSRHRRGEHRDAGASIIARTAGWTRIECGLAAKKFGFVLFQIAEAGQTAAIEMRQPQRGLPFLEQSAAFRGRSR